MILDLDEHLDFVASHMKKTLSISEANDLEKLIKHGPILYLQVQLLSAINGKLTQLSAVDVTKEGSLLFIAKTQGEIQGMRSIFDLISESLSAAENKGGLDS